MAKTNQKLSAKAKKSARSRHNWALQWCWNYERMQASGFAYAMVPVMKELYDNDEERSEHLTRHMQFYNSHPGASSVIFGASVALEESYQPDVSDSIKVGLMGPMAGIGDTIQAVLVLPPFNIIAASLAAEGSWLSLVASMVPTMVLFALRWPLFTFGYNRSVSLIEDVAASDNFTNLEEAASILGLTVVGGFVPSILSSLALKLEFSRTLENPDTGEVVESVTRVQDTLDAIMPYMIPVALVFFCYWLITKRKMTPVQAIGIVFVIFFILGATGLM